jgi:hypothetical protein
MIRRSWTQAASIEETLALWAASLREIKTRIRPLFRQERVATNAGLFLEGLLGDEHRKTGWMRAEAAGDPGPWRQQAILGRRDWNADDLRDIVRAASLRQRPGYRRRGSSGVYSVSASTITKPWPARAHMAIAVTRIGRGFSGSPDPKRHRNRQPGGMLLPAATQDRWRLCTLIGPSSPSPACGNQGSEHRHRGGYLATAFQARLASRSRAMTSPPLPSLSPFLPS